MKNWELGLRFNNSTLESGAPLTPPLAPPWRPLGAPSEPAPGGSAYRSYATYERTGFRSRTMQNSFSYDVKRQQRISFNAIMPNVYQFS